MQHLIWVCPVVQACLSHYLGYYGSLSYNTVFTLGIQTTLAILVLNFEQIILVLLSFDMSQNC